MNLEEGVNLDALPKSSSDLPASLPFFGVGATVTDLIGGVVLSTDCAMSPALYVPTDEEIQSFSNRRGRFELASDKIPNYRETLRKVYDDSSRAVHGGKLKHAAKNQELVSGGQDICRKGILKRLEEPEKPKWEELILGPGL